jgi:hypothetical protein
MGCYNEVRVQCPICGLEQYVQSKGGECLLRAFDLGECPEDVLSDVNRHAPFECWEPVYDANGCWSQGGPTQGCRARFEVDGEKRVTRLCEGTGLEEGV